MAKVGLRNFRYGILTEHEDGTATYGEGYKPAKAISCSVEISNNEATLYADDSLAESDTSFQSGTATLGIDDEDDVTMARILGHQIVDGEMIRNAYDVAPYLGMGRIITKMVNGVYKYKVEFLKKVKFAEPSQEENTRGESVEFATGEIEGTISALKNGDWSATKTFNTMSEAQTYLDSFFGTTEETTYTVTYNVNGGTGTIEPVEVTAGESITLHDGTGITAPTGKTFSGWARTSTAQSSTVTSPFTPTGDTILYAVYTDAN